MTPADMAATHGAAFPGQRPWSEAEFAALLDVPLCFATGDRRCFALVRVVADEAELLTLATLPAYRRHGLARAVMHAWMARAASQGAARAFVEVAADNSAALPLYESCGFALCGVRRDYYRREGGAAADALLLACPLPGGRAAES